MSFTLRALVLILLFGMSILVIVSLLLHSTATFTPTNIKNKIKGRKNGYRIQNHDYHHHHEDIESETTNIPPSPLSSSTLNIDDEDGDSIEDEVPEDEDLHHFGVPHSHEEEEQQKQILQLDDVVLNSDAYSSATKWWAGKAGEIFKMNLRKEAEKVFAFVTSSSSTNDGQQDDDQVKKNHPHRRGGKSCSTTITRRLFYTHRKPRSKEVGNLEMARISKEQAFRSSSFLEIGEPLHRVVNPQPIQLNRSFDISKKKWGNWHVTFLPQPEKAHSSPQRVPAEPAMSVSLFPHAVVSYGNVVTCDGVMFSAGGCLWEGPGSRAVQSGGGGEAKNLIAVAMCDGWCRGYYHFSHEHLPRLALVHDLLMHNPHARLVLSHSPVSFAKQFYIDILKIPKDKILVAGHGGLRAGVVALPTPMRCGNAFTSALVGLRRLVLKHLLVAHHPEFHNHEEQFFLGAVPAQIDDSENSDNSVENLKNNNNKKKKRKLLVLFAERSHLSRMPRNYAILKQHIKTTFEDEADFEDARGNEHAREQVLRFYRADIVIGPHGANLANIMFMRSGRHVLEMASYKNGNLCYYSTAMRMNLTHHLVLHDKGKDSHYVFTKKLLEDHLRFAIDRVNELF